MSTIKNQPLTKSPLPVQEHILTSAGELFFRHGYRAVGVDAIVRHSGVAKMTLYRYFPSKDDLIAAYLQRVNGLMMEWLEAAIAQGGAQPRDQITAIFDALETLLQSPQCFGCAFLMAASEFPDVESPGHAVALEHKAAVRSRFEQLAAQAGVDDPRALAEQLLLVMDGAFAHVRLFGRRDTGGAVAQAARALLGAQLPER